MEMLYEIDTSDLEAGAKEDDCENKRIYWYAQRMPFIFNR